MLTTVRFWQQASTFAEELRAFYAIHSPESIPKVPALAKEYLGREKELNEALMRKYGQDMTTMAAKVCSKSNMAPAVLPFIMPWPAAFENEANLSHGLISDGIQCSILHDC